MHNDSKSVLLIAMPFAGAVIPSIQLPILEGYLQEQGISVQSRHLYLKAAELYGIKSYNVLIDSPFDSYAAQMVFSKYVFPDHWNDTIDRFRSLFHEKLSKCSDVPNELTFDSYVQRSDWFFDWAVANVDWQSFDLIGFTLNYGQFLPSLAIAKKIKELYPEKKIIFSGSRTISDLGVQTLETFDYIDFIVSGDREEPLLRLASDFENYRSVPHLIYREGKEVIWNTSDIITDINSIQLPSYDSFFNELYACSDEVKQYFYFYGRLPIEISRGCWWNNCTFCNQSAIHPTYREKPVDKVIEEIQVLSDTYKMLDFQFIGNTLPKQDFRGLLEKIKQLGKDFSFFVEARAGRLRRQDYTLLKDAGFSTIQTGIEAFSQSYLEKMDTGVRVIDNIAVLNFCQENGIVNNYNLIVTYPNEEPIDFEQTQQNIQPIKQYLDPPVVSFLTVEYGSRIYQNPDKFNVEAFDFIPVDKVMFPEEVLQNEIACFYAFKRHEDLGFNDWLQLVNEWKTQREWFKLEGLKQKTPIDQFVFYYVDGGQFLKIYDKRDPENIKIYVLNLHERVIFLACVDVISFHKLQEHFPDIPENELTEILHGFEERGIVYREDDYYLSLPLRPYPITPQLSIEKSQQLVYNSGIQRTL